MHTAIIMCNPARIELIIYGQWFAVVMSAIVLKSFQRNITCRKKTLNLWKYAGSILIGPFQNLSVHLRSRGGDIRIKNPLSICCRQLGEFITECRSVVAHRIWWLNIRRVVAACVAIRVCLVSDEDCYIGEQTAGGSYAGTIDGKRRKGKDEEWKLCWNSIDVVCDGHSHLVNMFR